jgi:molecular chaperone GrpE
MAKKHEDKEKPQPEEEPVAASDDGQDASQDKASENGKEAEIEQDVITALQQALQSAQDEAAVNLEGWQRAQAEFSNYKKRLEREQSQMRQDATGRITKSFLEVLDDLDRALLNKPAEGPGAEWSEGIDLVYRKMLTIMEKEGVTVMQMDGQLFDPNLHEAISQEESPDHKSGEIIEVLQKGYLIGDRVLRPALVRVAS